jgi:hypothetical protein
MEVVLDTDRFDLFFCRGMDNFPELLPPQALSRLGRG